jgi:hypothetical protein
MTPNMRLVQLAQRKPGVPISIDLDIECIGSRVIPRVSWKRFGQHEAFPRAGSEQPDYFYPHHHIPVSIEIGNR